MPAHNLNSSYNDDINNRLAHETLLSGTPDWFPAFTAAFDVVVLVYCEDQTKGQRFFCMAKRIPASIDSTGDYIDEHWVNVHEPCTKIEPLVWMPCHKLPILS